MRKKSAAERRIDSKYPKSRPGKASDYIDHIEDLVKEYPGLPVVLWCRVSGRMQDYKGDLEEMKARDRQELEKLGTDIVGDCQAVVSGWDEDRETLRVAARKARKAGAVLLAESTDRLIRSKAFHTKRNPGAQPTVQEFEELLRATQGVPLATILHPDTPWREVRAWQAKRGQHAKGRKGGRPSKKRPGCKKQKRLANRSKVFWMRLCGMSVRRIASLLKVPTMTVHDWIERMR